MKKFASLATGAVVASMIVPVFATEDLDSSTSVAVDAQAIQLDAGVDYVFDTAGTNLPGDTMLAESSFNVLTNNNLGYDVTLVLSDLTMSGGPRADGDKVAAASIAAAVTVASSAVSADEEIAAEAVGSSGTGLEVAKLVAGSEIRSLVGGDIFDVDLTFTMPWIEDGAYAGTATYTATQI